MLSIGHHFSSFYFLLINVFSDFWNLIFYPIFLNIFLKIKGLGWQVKASQDLTKESGGVSKVIGTNITNGFAALNNTNNNGDFSFTWFYLKTLLILGIIAIVLFYIFKFLRRSIKQTVIDNPFYQVVFNFPLSPNAQHTSKSIMVVKIVNHFYILAVTADGVHLLEKITDKETIDTLVIESDKEQVGKSTSFVDKVFEILQAKGYQKKMIEPLATTKNIRDKIKNI